MQSMQSELETLDRLLDTALDLPVEAREQWLESLPPEHDGEIIRIVSARKADRDEIKQYQWWLR